MCEDVLNWLCGELEVDKAELLSDRRFGWLVAKRRTAVCFFRALGKGYNETARILNRDHSSIIHLWRTASDQDRDIAVFFAERWVFINGE